MRDNRKAWKLELTCAELTILQVALSKFKATYDGYYFSSDELLSTETELFTYKYISQIQQESI